MGSAGIEELCPHSDALYVIRVAKTSGTLEWTLYGPLRNGAGRSFVTPPLLIRRF